MCWSETEGGDRLVLSMLHTSRGAVGRCSRCCIHHVSCQQVLSMLLADADFDPELIKGFQNGERREGEVCSACPLSLDEFVSSPNCTERRSGRGKWCRRGIAGEGSVSAAA